MRGGCRASVWRSSAGQKHVSALIAPSPIALSDMHVNNLRNRACPGWRSRPGERPLPVLRQSCRTVPSSPPSACFKKGQKDNMTTGCVYSYVVSVHKKLSIWYALWADERLAYRAGRGSDYQAGG